MYTQPLWHEFATPHNYPHLPGDTEADVAIIGGGITGITTALLLAQKGFKTIVLESLRVAGGTTGHSTGNLYCTVDKNLAQLHSKYDASVIKRVVQSRSAAINLIESLVGQHNIDCDFKRVPWILYSGTDDNTSKTEDEYTYAQDAGIQVSWAEALHLPAGSMKGVEVKNQAQINPLRYVSELANAVRSDYLTIYEDTAVMQVDDNKDHVVLHTTRGVVRARCAVHATHTPKGVKVYHTLLGPYREYGIACPIGDKPFPEGIFWGYYEEGKKYSVRLYERNSQRYVLIIGEPHKVGQSDNNVLAIRNLETFAARHLGLTEVSHRWGGQHYRPADYLPYIGRESKTSNIFVATGYSTDGLVYGTLAAMIIAGEIAGNPNQWADLYDAHRFTPLKSAKEFLKENINVAAEFLKAIPGIKDTSEFDNVKPGTGAVVEKDKTKIAVYRDETGKLTLVSAVCTHMKCIVNWNNAEKTWDCPCHGSRFKPDGTILEGPVFHPLQKIHTEGNTVVKENK